MVYLVGGSSAGILVVSLLCPSVPVFLLIWGGILYYVLRVIRAFPVFLSVRRRHFSSAPRCNLVCAGSSGRPSDVSFFCDFY